MTVATPHSHRILLSSFESGAIKSVRYYLLSDDVVLPSDEGFVGDVAYENEENSHALKTLQNEERKAGGDLPLVSLLPLAPVLERLGTLSSSGKNITRTRMDDTRFLASKG